MAPVLLPVNVRLWALVSPKAIAPALLNVMVSAVVALEESRVAVSPLASPIVNRWSVDAAAEVPRYCSVPPPKTRLLAILVALPMLLALPPLASVPVVPVVKTPALRVVTPV